MRIAGMVVGLLLGISASLAGHATASSQEGANREPIYSNVSGTIALDNERVRVRRFVIQPGQSTGRHAHAARQLLIFIKGGVLTSKTGRSTLWPD